MTPPMILQNTTKKSRTRNVSNSSVIKHNIDGWVIQESLEKFPQKENEVKQEEKIFLNQSDVQQWSIDDVCLFFERTIGVNCYTSIIQEHLIDGFALLLLKEEHLFNIFKMPFGSRKKILQQINQFQI